jgi:CxxC-x17-CxxC domain-containing protein
MTLGALAEIEFQDRFLICVDCGEEFLWSSGAQAFFRDKGLKNEPRRCYTCKQAKNDRIAKAEAARVEGKEKIAFPIVCAQCETQTTVPFIPVQGKPVYCRRCFLARSSGSGGPNETTQGIADR